MMRLYECEEKLETGASWLYMSNEQEMYEKYAWVSKTSTRATDLFMQGLSWKYRIHGKQTISGDQSDSTTPDISIMKHPNAIS